MLPGVDVSEQGRRRDPMPAWGPGGVSGTVSVGCCEAPAGPGCEVCAEWAGQSSPQGGRARDPVLTGEACVAHWT